jgi:aspartate aminotransferase
MMAGTPWPAARRMLMRAARREGRTPMSLSLIAQNIGESATLKLNETAAILRAKGDPVIHLGGGEPKGRAPLDAVLAASALLNSGEVRYTPPDGIPALKQAIIRYTEEFYGFRPAPENVMASGGAKQAIMSALHAILNPQEEIIFPCPYWVSYPDMARLVGAIGVPVRPEDGGFIPRIQDIEQVTGSYTKAVILNSPNNPSGAVYPAEFVADVVDFCERRSLWLIMDDIYHRLIFDGRQPVNCWEFTRDRSDNSKLIIINGISKQYAMTGFRIGWAVGNTKVIEAMTNIQGHETSGPSALLQHAAVGAINGLQSRCQQPPPHPGEQPQRAHGATALLRRRRHRRAGRHLLLLPRFQPLLLRLGEALAVPARQGPGGHCARGRVRHGGHLRLSLLRFDQGHHRGRRAYQMGAGSQLAQRAVHR